MAVKLTQGLKATFMIHLVVAAAFGLGFLFVPDLVGPLYGIQARPPVLDVFRLLGAAMIGWGFSSLMAFRSDAWEKVSIVVLSEVVWTGLGALAMLYALLFQGFPPLGWLNFGIFAAFALAFAWFYTRK